MDAGSQTQKALLEHIVLLQARVEQLERSARASEAAHRRWAACVPAIVYTAAIDGRRGTLDISPQVEHLLGYSPAEFQRDPNLWYERLHPDDRDGVMSKVQRCHANNEPLACEYRMITRDGHVIWFRDEAVIMWDDKCETPRLQGVMCDITERRRIENLLRKNEEMLRWVFQASPALISVATVPEGRYLDVNHAYCQMLGFEREEIVGRTAAELGVWADLEERKRAVALLQEKGAVFNFEARVRKKNGEVIDTLLSSAIMATDGPQYSVSVCTDITALKRAEEALRRAHDELEAKVEARTADLGKANEMLLAEITERKKAEHALRESDARLQEQFEELSQIYTYTPVGLCVLDRDLRYLRINERLAEINGHSVEEHLGRTFDELLPDLAEHCRELWRPVLESGEPLLDIEISGHTPKDPEVQRHWLTSFLPRRSTTGEVIGLFCTITEITDRKRAEEALRESEERFRMVLENSLDAVYRRNLETDRYDYMSPVIEQIIGFSAAEMSAMSLEEVLARIHPDDLAGARRDMQKGGYAITESRFKCKNGEYRWLADGFRIVTDAQGRPVYHVGAVRDITERKRAQAEREQLQAQLQQAQKMEAIGRLSGGVAHDFNNLLTVIQGNAEIASMVLQTQQHGEDCSKFAAALDEIQQAAERAALLTGQLLTFSSKHVAQTQVLDVGRLAQGVQTMLRRLIRENIAFEVTCSPGGHLIHADRMQMEQVLVNLALNASDAMPDGGKLTIQVTDATLDQKHVRKHVDARTGPHVLITVADTGIGIAKSNLDHVFEPFFTTKPFGKGTGLGLAIVYGIVRQFGGHIVVESKRGQGSTFRLYFPAIPGEVSESVEPSPPQWVRGHETILLCEDEASLRQLAVSVLRKCGYTVIEAENGEQAVKLAADHTGLFQLLITDVVMPGMNGDKVAAAIRKDQPAVHVLFMSGYASDVLNVASVSQSGLEFLQKPFKPEVLLRRVREVLDREGR